MKAKPDAYVAGASGSPEINFDLDSGGSCYDCGSTIKGHHTKSCAFPAKGDKRDLPEIPGTQWWIEARDAFGAFVTPSARSRTMKQAEAKAAVRIATIEISDRDLYMAFNQNGTPLMKKPASLAKAKADAKEYHKQTGNAVHIDFVRTQPKRIKR